MLLSLFSLLNNETWSSSFVRNGEAELRFLFVAYVTSLNDENTSHKLAVISRREVLRFKIFVTLFVVGDENENLLHTGSSQSGERKFG